MKNEIRTVFFSLVLVLVAFVSGSPGLAATPNVLFIAVDDLRPELASFGRTWIESPNIDRLAREGMVFESAYVQQALCSPSRTSVMTGMRPDTTKVWDLATHFRKALPNVVTLPQLFREHGYFTQGIGKVYHPGVNDERSWSTPWVSPSPPTYALPENRATPGRLGAAYESANVGDSFYKDGKVAGLAIAALRNMKNNATPFFLAVGFVKPHLPFVAPEKYWDLYDPAEIALAPNPFRPEGAPNYAINQGLELLAYRDIPKGPIPVDLATRLKHGYYASVSYMDAQVGRLLDELDRLGLRENTIVVLWGDHGWKLGEHDGWGKQTNVENDVNSPLIVSVPGMAQAGQRTEGVVEFVDIYPTLAELAGLPLASDLEGVSFTRLLDNPDLAWKTAAFSQCPRSKAETGLAYPLMGYSMRTDRYRFTVWVRRADHTKVEAIELYDRSIDPQENTNIANDPAQAATVERLMVQWKKGWRGALPPPT